MRGWWSAASARAAEDEDPAEVDFAVGKLNEGGRLDFMLQVGSALTLLGRILRLCHLLSFGMSCHGSSCHVLGGSDGGYVAIPLCTGVSHCLLVFKRHAAVCARDCVCD
jgi:hypothetical protein